MAGKKNKSQDDWEGFYSVPTKVPEGIELKDCFVGLQIVLL
jgi:hypothetical protein